MKIFHTSDLHIRSVDDQRYRALVTLLKECQRLQANVLTIGGDLFDSNVEGGTVYPELRKVFEAYPFEVVIIPGNHDQAAFPMGVHLGKNVHMIQDAARPLSVGDVTIWGLPFQDLSEEEVLKTLRRIAKQVPPSGTHVLLFHGELLDIADFSGAFGDEGEKRYMPVRLAFFEGLPWKYILAGHFHTTFHIFSISGASFFVYPGSPIPVTRREIGPRKACLIEVGSEPREVVLPTPYYEVLELKLDPLSGENPFARVEASLSSRPGPARLLVSLSGYFDSHQMGVSEQELITRLQTILQGRGELVEIRHRDIHDILDTDLFRRFKEKVDSRESETAQRQALIELALRAMMEANL